LVILFVFSGLTVGTLVGYAMNRSSSRSGLEAKAGTNESTGENLKTYREQNKALAKALKDKNLFYAPPKAPDPPTVCHAIFGDEAYIQYEGKFKWYKVGEKIGEHGKVTGIEATYVQVDWKGQEKKLAPIAVAEATRPGPTDAKLSSSKGPTKPGTAIKPVDRKGKDATAKKTSEGLDELSWFDGNVSPETRAKLERLWSLMPDAEKERAKQEWVNMSDEEKDKALKELENIDIDMIEEQMQRRNR